MTITSTSTTTMNFLLFQFVATRTLPGRRKLKKTIEIDLRKCNTINVEDSTYKSLLKINLHSSIAFISCSNIIYSFVII